MNEYLHSNLDKLMETRKGRCGEWANLFCLFSISMGFETRYILDFTDHVWVEFYSDNLKKWVHLDPCENAFDQPLIYEAGWNKKLNYIFAFGEYELKDVIRRYSRQTEVYQRRNQVEEDWLESVGNVKLKLNWNATRNP
jgi:peptide-N4-(N-acetyl-beta-glucosaminyl)asparagine amidase